MPARHALLLPLALLCALPAAPASAANPPDYRDVQPILIGRCAKCHAQQGLLGPAPEGYQLTSYARTLDHAERARVVPGRAEASELVRRIRGQARPRMPHDGPPYLDDGEIALLVEWINQGARNAQGRPAALPVGARVRLHGRLEADWHLDGLALRVTPATRLERGPRPGDYVRVRGRLDADGQVQAERIRARR